MPVTSQHPEYQQHQAHWQQCRDAADGEDAVKARAEQYLPRLTEQTDDEYNAYRKRASWYGATGRTVQGLAGAVFRKPPVVTVPPALEPHLKDITMNGVDLDGFAKTAITEVLKVGRYGILVDMGKDQQELQRPYWVGYRAEQIINWATRQLQGDTILTMVVLEEEHREDDPRDAFQQKTELQYRVLWLRGGQYEVEIYRKAPQPVEGEEWVLAETIVPTIRNKPLPFIPFVFVNPTQLTTCVEKPPLLDLVVVNLSHYRNAADHEHGIHHTALPTPWVAGFPTDTVLKIGPSIAWVASDPNAKAGMLEFTGDGLGTIERALDRKERHMAILGARMLEEHKKAVEAAETLRIRGAGEHSVLASLAGTTEAAVRMCLQWHAQWNTLDGTSITADFNKDFYDVRMDPVELGELMKAWQGGAISHETLYWNMQRGELTRPGVTFEDEQELIDEEEPATIPLGGPFGGGFGQPGAGNEPPGNASPGNDEEA